MANRRLVPPDSRWFVTQKFSPDDSISSSLPRGACFTGGTETMFASVMHKCHLAGTTDTFVGAWRCGSGQGWMDFGV